MGSRRSSANSSQAGTATRSAAASSNQPVGACLVACRRSAMDALRIPGGEPFGRTGLCFVAHTPSSRTNRSARYRPPHGGAILVAQVNREEMMAGLLDGKCAVITGGGGGIGRATALAFAREGARVAVADIAADAARETVGVGQRRWRAGDIALGRGCPRSRGQGVNPRCRRRLWPARLRLQQCRDRRLAGRSRRQEDRRVVRGSLRSDDRGQSEGRVAVHEARAQPDAGPGWRRHRQHRLDRWARRVCRPPRPMSRPSTA